MGDKVDNHAVFGSVFAIGPRPGRAWAEFRQLVFTDDDAAGERISVTMYKVFRLLPLCFGMTVAFIDYYCR